MEADASLIVGGLDVAKLSDDELFEQLSSHGAVVGPIVGTTRKIYQRKLVTLLGGSVNNSSFSESFTPDCGGESDVPPSQAYKERLTSGAPRGRLNRSIRVVGGNLEDEEEEEEEEECEEAVERCLGSTAGQTSTPLYSPSPRRPLHPSSAAFSSYKDNGYDSTPLLPRPSLTHRTHQTSPASPQADRSSSPVTGNSTASGSSSIVFKIIALVIICALLYFFFIAKPEKDGFASLEHMAKTAADAMHKSKSGGHQDAPKRTGL
ncbi:LEM protein 2 isoform X2 [Hyalella azteca]|uniref:LEM protein 2 isoform X2 n=1 Tax=Hyalella azteca TaxID=294128 RepID=A0A8B7PEC0_HYAAZ|nr:LEM protein 2 isoform X2 [Hyalella azteca]